jgi:phosphoenolpyruvate carboxylase
MASSVSRTIGHRLPCLDSLNHLHVELLRRFRRLQAAKIPVDRAILPG